MTEIVLHYEAFDELRDAFIEAGVLADDGDMLKADAFTVQDITYKLWTYVPTVEEIARREAFYATPAGKMFRDMSQMLFQKAAADLARLDADYQFMTGEQWPIGTALKIRLPADYNKDHA